MKNMLPTRFIALILVFGLLVSACSSRETQPDSATDSDSTGQTAAATTDEPTAKEGDKADDNDAKADDSEAADSTGKDQTADDKSAADSSGSVTIVDQRDITIKLDKPADRIVTAVIPAPAIFAAVDGSYDRIVGQNEVTNRFNKLGIASTMFPQSADMPTISKIDFVPNMEEVIRLNPDLVIQWAHFGDEIITPLEEANIPTATLVYGTQKDLEQWIRIFGEAIAKQDRANDMLEWMKTTKENVASKTKGLEKVRAIQLRGKKDALVADHKGSYTQDQFEIAGAINVAADLPSMHTTITNEDLIKWDPEVIFMSTFMPDTPDAFYNDPALANVSAVKNKRVYKTPYGMFHWHVPCAESPLMWQWAAQVFHPEAFGADMAQVTKEGMKYLYNYEMTDEDLAVVLQAKANAQSAEYGVTFKQ